ncbi:DUF3857 domain-containing protein [Pedobacter sp. MW01-1-1]|uniref:DUF3857 domain-containing protein n=1 Tax=Pedobacter sp. MW01-1-1 TaxID=3383027 RepID=UPI003FEE2FF4
MLKKIILSIVLVVLSTFYIFAQKPNVSIKTETPNWIQKFTLVNKKPSDVDIQDGYYLYLSEFQNNLESKEQYVHIIRKISSNTGVQNGSEISVSFNPSYEKLVFHSIQVKRDGKVINKLDLRKIKVLQDEKELSRFIYSGTFSAYLILDDIRTSDEIEYAYTLQGGNPVFPKYANILYFEGGSQIVNLYTNVIFNDKRPLKFKNFNTVPKRNERSWKNLKVYEWQSAMTKTYPTKDYEPSSYNPFARVQISEYADWKEVVQWGLALKDFKIKNAPSLQAKIAELKEKAKGDKTKYATLATRFVQDEIRYMGIEIGEYSHRPNNPEKVLNQRYGDCKDKSTLLCYLLNANQITAYSVYLNTYYEKEVNTYLPSPNIFNHEVVHAIIDEKPIYIDPTIADQRGELKSIYFPYNTDVLVISPTTTKLESLPPQQLGKTKSEAVFKVADTSKHGKTYFTITTLYTKNKADYFRSQLSSTGLESLEKEYLKFYAEAYPNIKRKEKISIADDELNNEITVKESYEIEGIWTKSQLNKGKLAIYFYADLIQGNLFTLKKKRDEPLSLQYPFTVDQHIKVILPFVASFQNESLSIDKDKYRFIYGSSGKGNTINITFYYQNFADRILPNEMDDYIEDIQKISNSLSYGIVFTGNTALASDTTSDLNYWMVLLSVILFLVFTPLCIYLYFKKSNFDLEAINHAPKIHGLLFIVGFRLFITPFIIAYNMFNSSDFNQSEWESLAKLGRGTEFYCHLIMLFNNAVCIFCFCASILLIVLFLDRRKEFPKYFVFVESLALFTVLVILTNKFMLNGVTYQNARELGRTIGAILWPILFLIYILISKRVKRTFVFTYPNSAWLSARQEELSRTFVAEKAATKVEENTEE